jgi:tyrosyl-tRNA synthetase
MYGKVMSLPDSAMLNFYTLVTRYGPEQIAAVERGLADGTLHPMEAKKRLAHEIVSAFYGDEAAQGAAAHFRRVFQAGQLPADMPLHHLNAQAINVVDLLVDAGLARSKSQARRLVQQGGVRLDGEQIADIERTIVPDRERVLQVGKRKFVRIIRET